MAEDAKEILLCRLVPYYTERRIPTNKWQSVHDEERNKGNFQHSV